MIEGQNQLFILTATNNGVYCSSVQEKDRLIFDNFTKILYFAWANRFSSYEVQIYPMRIVHFARSDNAFYIYLVINVMTMCMQFCIQNVKS